MSDKKKESPKGKAGSTSHSNDDDQLIDNLEAGNEISTSSPNLTAGSSHNSSVDTKQDLQQYVAKGIQVQANDVLMIKDVSREMISSHEQSSDEESEVTITTEFPNDFDEEKFSELNQTCFDDIVNFRTLETAEKSHLQNHMKKKGEMGLPDKKKRYIDPSIKNKVDENMQAIHHDTEQKVKKLKKSPIHETQYNKCKVVEKRCIPIYTHISQNYDTSQLEENIKCPEYGSDEFADVEDNVRDSSSDNNESSSCEAPSIGLFSDAKLVKKGNKEQNLEGNKTSTIKQNGSGMNSSDPEVKFEDNFFSDAFKQMYEASCSYSPERIALFSDFSPLNEGNKAYKASMETIVEVPEPDNKAARSSISKPNSLKMKAKVGNRKDKCNVCNVKLGLCAIKCRCGGYYCAKHRYDREHACSFDYKRMGADEIRKNNPKVIAEKVRKL